MVAALDALRELDLLGGGEQVDLADVLEEELQRVSGNLARLLGRLLFLLLRAGDDLDVQLFECVVEVVDLARLELELVERDGDLVGAELAVLLARLQERLCIIRLEQVRNGPRCCDDLYCAHSCSPLVEPAFGDAALCQLVRTKAIGRTAHFCAGWS